jgi:virulence factor Mce-like protein
MVTQAPKRSAVAAALAFVLSCVGLMVFVWTQFGGTIPLSAQGYRLHGLFKETGLLVPNADVRISGVNVGKVTTVQNRGLNSYVTMDIKKDYVPVPKDTRAIIRQKTLLGEAYVMLSTGTGNGPIGKFKDGDSIPSTQIEDTQALDQVLGSFDKPTQQNLQRLLTGTFTAIGGRGQDLNDALGNLDPAVSELTAVVGVLNAQQGNLQKLINNTGTVLTTLGNRSADLQSFVIAGDQVLSATAARDVQLTATINGLPPFLAQLRTTLATLDSTLAIAKPTLAALRPVAPLLTPALTEVVQLSYPAIKLLHSAPSLLSAAQAALPSITRFSAAFKPAIDALLPATREVAPMISFIGLYSKELTTAMANLGATLQGIGPANTAATAGTPAGQAHYLRAVSPINAESIYGHSVREPTNRHSAYYASGEQTNIGTGGLLSSDCNNVGNAVEVPLLALSGNVPCRVQPGFSFNSITAYYPHVTRTPLPKK